VLALVGLALTRILINDTRFVSRQDAMLSARQGARAGLNALVSELSVVADSAVLIATRDTLQIRIPVAFGVTCEDPSTTTRIVSLLPVDSVAWANADTTGLYWRQRNGIYRRLYTVTMATTTAASDSALCKQDSIRMLSGGRLIKVSGLSSTTCSVFNNVFNTTTTNCQPDSLAVTIVYSKITYRFGASTDLPGRVGLWRVNNKGVAEELVTPFDTSARFAYLMGGPNTEPLTLQTATVTGTGLDSIRGVELRLYSASEQAAQGTSKPQVFKLRTRVRFANKVS